MNHLTVTNLEEKKLSSVDRVSSSGYNCSYLEAWVNKF